MLHQNQHYILIPHTRNLTPHISWYPRVFWGGFTEPTRFPAGTATPAGGEILLGSVSRSENTRVYQEMCYWGFGYVESEYEISLLFHPGTELKFERTAKFGVGRSQLGVPGHIHPELKVQWLNWLFFYFQGGKIGFFSSICQVTFSMFFLRRSSTS